jgi:pyruvate dehydrogenase E2 component (dihydrolipoamide acetyltransferase)
MSTEVRLVQWGMGMQEGTVLRWHRAEGDPVVEGEPLVEVEAEKVTADVPAPVSGTLARIVAQVGETVAVRAVLAVID